MNRDVDQYCLGVDLSHWQAAINGEPLLRAGVRFAIMKLPRKL